MSAFPLQMLHPVFVRKRTVFCIKNEHSASQNRLERAQFQQIEHWRYLCSSITMLEKFLRLPIRNLIPRGRDRQWQTDRANPIKSRRAE
jgi:hypothetical protein